MWGKSLVIGGDGSGAYDNDDDDGQPKADSIRHSCLQEIKMSAECLPE